ncbi:MAG TPA: HAD-IIB family hydrolase [Candidatus Binatia bacterium]|nr:HAD-IIB family hydrolase [Candidatus Binatia bacterium]
MRYLGLACDYDGTLAHAGRVADKTVAALERLRASGRKLILVTGRELPDLLSVFPRTDLFEWVVAENGCLLYRPSTQEKKPLSEPPPAKFVLELQKRNVAPLSIGQSIVATWTPHETTVLDVIRQLGLELQVIFNKGAVMVLPAGHNKATGLAAALDQMLLSPHNIVAIGDAENDHAFLKFCECSVATSNALPVLKESVDFVTAGINGAGVTELIDEIIRTDLSEREPLLSRYHILLGTRENGEEVRIGMPGLNLLLAGSSGGGKSTAATSIVERLVEQRYQFCLIDPEGDYAIEDAVTLGGQNRPPTIDEALSVLNDPHDNAVINLVGLALNKRPEFFLSLLTRLQELRSLAGRPHMIIVDEAHHVLPASWEPASIALPKNLDQMIYITVEPKSMSGPVLPTVNTVVALGGDPRKILSELSEAVGEEAPRLGETPLQTGEVLVWLKNKKEPPFKVKVIPTRGERRRHKRKYAEGDLGPDRSFYFQGPEKKLHLQAQNLMLFIQLADGLDDETWTYHLREGDYSKWFRDVIKDETLAAEAVRVEGMTDLSAAESRKLIKAAINERYTAPV